MQKWLILDRDGVINQDSDHFIKTPEEWIAIPGSLTAIARLNQAGYKIAVISNQSGIARGLLSLATLDMVHQKLHAELKQAGGSIDALYFCPHGPDDDCDCRKPLAGLFLRFAKEHKVNLKLVCALGDSVRDLVAAQTVGAKAILVKTGKGSSSIQALAKLEKNNPLHTAPIFENLAAFTDNLLSKAQG